MSAFLGPIHDWLYEKIMVQESMVEEILKLNKFNGFVIGLEETVDFEWSPLEKRPLEEMIDVTNIHGWLQEKVSIVERRLSYVVTVIVKDNEDRMEFIKDAMYQLGKHLWKSKYSNKTVQSAEQVYKLQNDLLLDGMPCDHVLEVISNSESEVVYRMTRCIHECYWLEQGGLVMNYYELRSAFVNGLLEATEFEFKAEEEGLYYIRRK